MLDYMSTSREAMDIYEDRLRQAEENRRASKIVAANRQNRGMLQRVAESITAITKWPVPRRIAKLGLEATR